MAEMKRLGHSSQARMSDAVCIASRSGCRAKGKVKDASMDCKFERVR